MVFWAGIIVGGLFVVWAVWNGFYETWVRLFNSIISIYLAIFLKQTVAVFVPAVADSPYSNAIIVFLLFFASFAILEGLAYIFFTSQFDVPFPKILDYIGSGIVGFFNGLLIWSFVCFLASLTPLSKNETLVEFGFVNNFQKHNIMYIKKFINPVNSFVSSKANFLSTDQMITELIKDSEKALNPEIRRAPSEPNKIGEPNSVTDPNKISGRSHRLSSGYTSYKSGSVNKSDINDSNRPPY